MILRISIIRAIKRTLDINNKPENVLDHIWKMIVSQLVLVVFVLLGTTAQRRQVPRDYPFLAHIPKTSFDCKRHPVGYYADPDPATKCQVYHMCDMKGNKFSYLCPNGTLFHQQLLICAHWYQVNCTKSRLLYEVNKIMFPYERFKSEPQDRLHKHDRPTLTLTVNEPDLILEQTSTPISFENRNDQRRTFPPFDQFRQFSHLSQRTAPPTATPANDELLTQQTIIVEKVATLPNQLTTPSDLPTTDFTTIDSDQTLGSSDDITTNLNENQNSPLSTDAFEESTPWWSQLGPHNPAPAPDIPNINTESSSVPVPTTVPNVNSNLSMRFPKLGNSNQLSDLPINDQCPLCSPLFIQDGHCSPCVVIRR